MAHGPTYAIPLVLLVATLCEGCAVAVFWSVHHRKQPLPLAACSIAAVNSFGNLGGFGGTYVLGYLHDAARGGAAAAAATSVSDWSFGTGVIGVAFLVVTGTTAVLLRDGGPLSARDVAAERCMPLLGRAVRL